MGPSLVNPVGTLLLATWGCPEPPAFSLTPRLLWGWGGSQMTECHKHLEPARPRPRSLHPSSLLPQHGPATPGAGR